MAMVGRFPGGGEADIPPPQPETRFTRPSIGEADFIFYGSKGRTWPTADDVVATVQMICHRDPALEFYAEQMRGALPDVKVNTQLMPHDKAMELATIAMSSKADTIDVLHLNDSTFLSFAKKGWLLPLDDLYEKFKDEVNLGDFADSALDTFRYEGKLYVFPHRIDTQLFFYRKDLLQEAGAAPPKNFTEYRALAEKMHSPLRAGTTSCLKPVDAALNEMHWYMNPLGGGWFDDKMKPVINGPTRLA